MMDVGGLGWFLMEEWAGPRAGSWWGCPSLRALVVEVGERRLEYLHCTLLRGEGKRT